MKNILNKTSFFLLVITFLLSTVKGFSQFTIPEKPSFQTSVYDYAKILNENENAQLEEKLIKYSDSTTSQIVVVTIENLKGEDVAVVATNWAQKWGIGQAKEDNGVMLLVSRDDRKLSIRPGYGVEDRLTAGVCGEIIRNVIVPEFKAGSYYNGLDKGADVIFEVLKGKYKGERIADSSDKSILPVVIFIIFFIILMIIISKNKNNGNNGGNSGGPSLLDMIILSNMGRSSGGGFGGSSGGGFGGSSGGGFGGGFGGGGFSGGGASGGW